MTNDSRNVIFVDIETCRDFQIPLGFPIAAEANPAVSLQHAIT